MIYTGKQVVGRRYAHLTLLPCLSEQDQQVAQRAIQAVGLRPFEDFDVVRFDDDRAEVALLAYPGFFTDPFPILERSWRVQLTTSTVRSRSYAQSLNPPILHRKELMLPPDHPERAAFLALTQTAESLGLFDDPIRIGFRSSWLELIRSKGYKLEGSSFIPLGNAEGGVIDDPAAAELDRIHRHLTALARTTLSAPVQLLLRHSLLSPAVTFFDYGCGKGGDLEHMAAMGVPSGGWDPHFRPDGARAPADVVNLGFVINVIEDFTERVEALTQAFALTRSVLAVSAMIRHQDTVPGRPYRDGVLTGRNTFQKYYSQPELQQFIECVLEESAIPVAPGVFYVFRDQMAEQRFLLSRTSGRTRAVRVRIASAPRRPSAPKSTPRIDKREKDPVEKRAEDPARQALAEIYWGRCLELGRQAEFAEVEFGAVEDAPDLASTFRTPGSALRYCLRTRDESKLEQCAQARKGEILTMLALLQFSRRARFKELDARLQRDIKAFFGSLTEAEEEARHLLHAVSDTKAINDACEQAARNGIGHLEEGHSLHFHSSLADRLPPLLRVYLGCGTAMYGDVTGADLVKLHIQSGKITLMRFDDFLGKPIPAMVERVKIRLRDQGLDIFEYGGAFPPPLYFLKARVINEELPNYAEQIAFEEDLERLGLFDFSDHGPSPVEFWSAISQARWAINGFRLERANDIPNMDDPCGTFFTYRQLIECGETWHRTHTDNTPKSPITWAALADLARFILDPVRDYFGAIKLTYGFCSQPLAAQVPGRIAPALDQHAAHETNRKGRAICARHGAAVDFLVEDEDMLGVAMWIARNLPFDRLYYYGPDRPVHVSYGPEHSREFFEMLERNGRRVPKKLTGMASG